MFDSRVGLKIHKAIGHGPFKCELCPKSFPSFQRRDAHRRAHLDKGPLIYSCRECGEKFSTEEGVICHKTIYSGGKFYVNCCQLYFQAAANTARNRQSRIITAIDERRRLLSALSNLLKSSTIFQLMPIFSSCKF
jgi:hypothetical protein